MFSKYEYNRLQGCTKAQVHTYRKAVILSWTEALPSKARCYNAGAGVQNTNTGIILGLKAFLLS
jgi:hypothetical protein